jgi:hypothetical protein
MIVLARIRDRERGDQPHCLEQAPASLSPVWDQPAVSPIANLPLGNPRQLHDLAARERVPMADGPARVENNLLLTRLKPRPERAHTWAAQDPGLVEPILEFRRHVGSAHAPPTRSRTLRRVRLPILCHWPHRMQTYKRLSIFHIDDLPTATAEGDSGYVEPADRRTAIAWFTSGGVASPRKQLTITSSIVSSPTGAM